MMNVLHSLDHKHPRKFPTCTNAAFGSKTPTYVTIRPLQSMIIVAQMDHESITAHLFSMSIPRVLLLIFSQWMTFQSFAATLKLNHIRQSNWQKQPQPPQAHYTCAANTTTTATATTTDTTIANANAFATYWIAPYGTFMTCFIGTALACVIPCSSPSSLKCTRTRASFPGNRLGISTTVAW